MYTSRTESQQSQFNQPHKFSITPNDHPIETTDEHYEPEEDLNPRIDIIVDLTSPQARGNLNKLLLKLYSDSPYLRIFVNKWQEWDDFSHKDNSAAPRATYFPGCF